MIHFYFLTPKKDQNIVRKLTCSHNCQFSKTRHLWHDFSIYRYPFGSVACMITFWSIWVYKRCILLTCYAKMVLSELGADLKTFCSLNGHHPRFSRYLRKRVLVVHFFKRRRDPKSHNAPYLTLASRQETNAFGVFAYLLALICCCLWLEYNIEHLLPISIRYPSNVPCRYLQFYKNQFFYKKTEY